VAALEGTGRRLFALNQIVVRGQTVACTAGAPWRPCGKGPRVTEVFAHALPAPST